MEVCPPTEGFAPDVRRDVIASKNPSTSGRDTHQPVTSSPRPARRFQTETPAFSEIYEGTRWRLRITAEACARIHRFGSEWFLLAIIPVIASKTSRCDRVSRRVRSQHVSATRCSPCPRRGGLPSLITMVVSPPSVRRPSPSVTHPTRQPSRSLATSRPWRASRDRPRRRPSRHAAARPARTVGHARAVRARGLPAPPRRSRRPSQRPPAGGRHLPSLPCITWRPCYKRAGRMGIREHRGSF